VCREIGQRPMHPLVADVGAIVRCPAQHAFRTAAARAPGRTTWANLSSAPVSRPTCRRPTPVSMIGSSRAEWREAQPSSPADGCRAARGRTAASRRRHGNSRHRRRRSPALRLTASRTSARRRR
jgi:hypothetical protein